MAADELGAVVGLPDQVAKRYAATLQMLLNPSGEQGNRRQRNGAAGKGPEQQAAADLAGGVLDRGQTEELSLRPVAGDIIQILGIGGDLLKRRAQWP